VQLAGQRLAVGSIQVLLDEPHLARRRLPEYGQEQLILPRVMRVNRLLLNADLSRNVGKRGAFVAAPRQMLKRDLPDRRCSHRHPPNERSSVYLITAATPMQRLFSAAGR